uniref:Uncharacterized protein n=1 Tax=Anguilla anguilla TaxID=7936 RepID=A0A0E9TRD0_ANGAN
MKSGSIVLSLRQVICVRSQFLANRRFYLLVTVMLSYRTVCQANKSQMPNILFKPKST